MEVVYDLDVVLAEQARSLGVHYARAATVGTAPQFVAMVGELIDERTRRDAPVRWLSALGRPSVDCTAACCAT
jgi:ferrochelatase